MNLVQYLFNNNTISLQVEVADWKAAIRAAIAPLIQRGAVEPRYCDAIIATATRNGPYFVLMPQVALPHARPEEGARALGFSLTTLKTPVNFGSEPNDPIAILLSFCAPHNNDQLHQALAQAVTVFEDEANVEAIIQARTITEMHTILHNISFE